jgi:replicative DNA helicase
MCETFIDKVSTGLPEVDKYLGGGAGAGELGIILGAPNAGKSIMLNVIGAGGLRNRKKVFHATMEMSGQKVALRYDYNLTGKNKYILKDSAKEVLKFLEDFQRSHKTNLHIKQWPTRTATTSMVKAYIDYLSADGFKPDLVLVDYAAIMKASTKRDGRHQEIEEINEELRGLAGELQVPVWTAAQTNSAGVGKAVLNIDDLGESFAQSKVADVILSICQTKKEYDEKVIRLFFAKNRDDQKFASLRYKISYELMRLQYAPE